MRDAAHLYEALPRMNRIATPSKLWIAWPKRASCTASTITPAVLREAANAAGLVGYKICSLDSTWSAMLFARRRRI